MQARLGIALLLGAALLAPANGHAAWSLDPVTVHATTDTCPLLAAASDAQDGALVVWQQNDAAHPGVYQLLAKRVLASGDVDASWPAGGALVSSWTVTRSALGALGDGSGGAYVWWMEDASLFLTRLLSDGTIATGWSARGKYLGVLVTSGLRPLVFADGQGGIWLGWLAGLPQSTVGRIAHLGTNGQGAGGWPIGVRSYAGSTQSEEGGVETLAFTYAPAPDGGAWVAWGDAPYDSAAYQAGSWRLKRLTSTGLTSPGWDGAGLAVGVFHGELLESLQPYGSPYLAASPLAVASDGADGAYLLLSELAGQGGAITAVPRLFHLDATGSPDPSWPAAGVVPYPYFLPWLVDYFYSEMWSDIASSSLRLFAEAAGGVFALRSIPGGDGEPWLVLERFTPAGTQGFWGSVRVWGFEGIVPPSGDTYLAGYSPHGAVGPMGPTAEIELTQTSASGVAGPGFVEWHEHPWNTWYMDIGLAPTSGNGAIFAWSQVYERHGVFARRFTDVGQVTAVPPDGAPAGALRLRFAPGRGVIATLGSVAGGRIQLFDVTGRVCGGADVPAGAHEVTLEGTAPLATGLYFARHRGSDGATETGRVLIVR